MGPACPRQLWSKAILLGGSTWLSKCVRALHFPLLGFETGLERENAWNYWDIFYKDLLQVTFDIRNGNTKDGWKKHGINRQPFFWFGTSRNKIEMQMTKIPKESADQKDMVWYYHGSCMPKTLLWSKAILFGGSTWLSKCVRALHFPLLGFETGLERENAWNYWDIWHILYEDLLQVTFDIRTGNTKDGWKKHGINRQPFFWFGTPSNKIMRKIPKESAVNVFVAYCKSNCQQDSRVPALRTRLQFVRSFWRYEKTVVSQANWNGGTQVVLQWSNDGWV